MAFRILIDIDKSFSEHVFKPIDHSYISLNMPTSFKKQVSKL